MDLTNIIQTSNTFVLAIADSPLKLILVQDATELWSQSLATVPLERLTAYLMPPEFGSASITFSPLLDNKN